MEARSTESGTDPAPGRARVLAVGLLLWGTLLYGLLALDIVRYSRATAGLRKKWGARCPWIVPAQTDGR